MKRLSQCWSLDLRSLALARILMSIVKVVDLYYRFEDFDFFYGRWCAPRSVVLEHMSTGQDISIFMASGARWWTDLCFFALLSATIAFGLGYRTGMATIILWFLELSLQNRNSKVLNGGDAILRLFLFGPCFCPWEIAFPLIL